MSIFKVILVAALLALVQVTAFYTIHALNRECIRLKFKCPVEGGGCVSTCIEWRER
jgi:hypothetical protein